jgi:SNF2 family DNA or RNA helicase
MEVKFYLELEQHFAEAVNSAAKSQKLLQLANGAVYVDPLTEDDDDPRSRLYKEVHDAKLQMLESIVNEASGNPVLVAYNFKSDLARLQKAFPKAVALNPGNVQAVMRAWNKGKIEMLLVHPASAGHGLNLQDGGNILVFFGLNWNLEQRLQVIERIGPVRQLQAGHDRPVFIYNILARDTIDELVLDRVETKREVQDLLLEAMARKRRRVA